MRVPASDEQESPSYFGNKTGHRRAAGLLIASLLAVAAGCEHSTAAPDPASAPAAELTASVTLPEVDEPDSQQPVHWGILVSPAEVEAGGTARLVVRARLASGWHLYAAEGPTAGSQPTILTLELPPGVTANGDWQLPTAHEIRSPLDEEQAIYEGDVVFVQTLAIAAGAADGPQTAVCRVQFQVCSEESCLPPDEVTLRADFTTR